MALKVWLPLNGNLNNQGLSDLTFSNTNTTNLTIDTGGKIGSCYQRVTKQTAGYITSNKTILLDNDITMCCWALVSDGIASANGLITNHNHSTNTGVGLTFKYISSTDFRISCNTGTGSGRTYDTYYGTTNIKNAWHHLALTYDNAAHQLLLYVDGTVEYTLNNYINASQEDWIRLFEWSTNYDNTNYRPAVKLNDVRIYDECLSQKQIKEISKGLVAHYKLDSPYLETTTNLVPGTTTYSITTNPAWDTELNGTEMYTPTGWASGYNSGVAEATSGYHAKWEFDEYGKLILKLPNLNSIIDKKGRWLGTSAWNLATTSILAGQKYTISWWQKTDNLSLTPRGGLYFKKTSDGTNNFYDGCVAFGYNTKLNTWEYMTHTFTRVSDYVENTQSQSIYIYGDNTTYEGTVYVKDIQLQLGDHATPYTIGTRLGQTHETDVSGNNYNGIVSGALSYNTDSIRYSGSIKFNSCLINSPAGAVLASSKDFTINGWFYHTAGTNYYASAESYNTSVCLENGRFFVYSANGSAYVGTWSATNNIWQMLTLVHNSVAKTLTLYVNGVQTVQIATDGTIYPNETLNIGGRQNAAGYTGSMSDFRIYATALSADEILTMYKTSGIIDNKQIMYGYEFKEV